MDKPLKILIIDDNEQITKMLTTFLELKDQQCTVANDGKEGLALIKNAYKIQGFCGKHYNSFTFPSGAQNY